MRGRRRQGLRAIGLFTLLALMLAGPLLALRPGAGVPIPAAAAEREGRIVNGVPVPPGRLTYTTAIMFKAAGVGEFQFCGGSLISPRYILTAGHCMYGREASKLKVYVGANNLNDLSGAVGSDVSRIIIHPKYDDDNVVYDVALMELPAPGITTIEPITLAGRGSWQDLEQDDPITIVGWGYLSEDGPSSDQLMRIDVYVQSDRYCQESYGVPDREMKVVFCAGERDGGWDACQGDSGGPAFHGGPFTDPPIRVQVGVVSYGNGCARPGFPGAYARISSPEIHDFIREYVPLDPNPEPPIIVSPGRYAAISPGADLTATANRPDVEISRVDFLTCVGHVDCPDDQLVEIASDLEAPWFAELPDMPGGNVTIVTRIWTGDSTFEDIEQPVYVQNPPDVQIRMPKDGTKSGKKVKVQVAAALAENGIAGVTLQECAGATCTDLAVDREEPWIFEFKAPPGVHTYQAVATDGAGNAGTSNRVTITVKKKK